MTGADRVVVFERVVRLIFGGVSHRGSFHVGNYMGMGTSRVDGTKAL
jgi:hypothetical protein